MSAKSVLRPLVGVTVLALAAAGCSSSSGGSASGGTASSGAAQASGGKTAGKTLSVQFVNPLPKYPAWRQAGDCIAAEVKKRGLNYTETGPTSAGIDPAAMIQQIQQAIADKKSAVITFPASDGFAPVLQQAQKAGIVTTTALGSGAAGSGADINIAADWPRIGRLYVDVIAKRPGQQKVGLMTQADVGPAKAWMDGVKAAAAKTTNVKIVGSVFEGGDSAKALEQTTALLTAHPDLTVIATNDGAATQGAVSAIAAKGLTSKVALVSNGKDNGGTQAIKSGAAYALLVQDLCNAGTVTADATADLLEGKTTRASGGTPISVSYGAAMATKDTFQSYLDKGWG